MRRTIADLQIDRMQFHEIIGGLIRSYSVNQRTEQGVVLCIAVLVQVAFTALATLLALHSHMELLWAGPAITHLSVAFVALRFVAMVKQPTSSTRRGLSFLAAAAIFAFLVSITLSLAGYLGWFGHTVAGQCVITVVMTMLRSLCTLWDCLRKRWRSVDEEFSIIELLDDRGRQTAFAII